MSPLEAMVVPRGTDGSNPASSTRQSVSRANSAACVGKSAFSAGLRAGASGTVGRDAPGAATSGHRAVILCWAIFRYRTAGHVNGLTIAVVFEFGAGSGEAERAPLIVPRERQT